ncbi:MAG TPA: Bax inhibitor-1/YccA family protein [Acholeplasmataceae bacterium]|nr:Bax inhibitor-1/YccA family protein [Acholeplasmataceae bacterium]
MALRSNNPVYNRIEKNGEYQGFAGEMAAATYSGVATKTLYFLALVFIGVFGGLWLMENFPTMFLTVLVGSLLTTFIFALLGLWFPRLTPVMGSLYCLGQGTIIGVVSLAFEMEAPGIVMTAMLSVVVVLAVVVTLFLTRIVRVNSGFMRFLLVFAFSFIISFFLVRLIDLIFQVGVFNTLLLPISLASTFLATLYLFFDMQRVVEIVEGGAPKHLEWYVSFGLVYTLLWIYIEILRLLAIIGLRRRD